MKTPKCILVTGCAGFIGGNFTKQFKKKYPKTKIVGIDDLSTGSQEVIDPTVKFYEGSILDTRLVEKVFAAHSPEYVFHFAALPRVSYSVENPRYTSEVNIIGTIALLEAAKNHGVKRFIFSSSSAMYGNAKKLPTNEAKQAPDPQTPYAAQKLACEPFCKMFGALYGLDTICLRYFNVYGPGQYGTSPYSTVISAWLESLYFPKKKKAFIEGDGSQSRDFCFVDDVVRANILAMKSAAPFRGAVVNIASGERTKVRDIRVLIEKYTGKKLDLEKRPPRLGDVKHTLADISKAKRILGYTPSVLFESGLKKTIAWFKTRKG